MPVLKDLLSFIPEEQRVGLSQERLSRKIVQVTSDSRAVSPGSVFVAVKGGHFDGHDFISEVVRGEGAKEGAGPVAVIGEREISRSGPIPYIRVADSRKALAWLAAGLYGHPTRSMKIVGVTGTSGKTTVTYLLESIFASAGLHVGVIGTVNVRYGGGVFPVTHTTPGPVELQGILLRMKEAGCTHVIIEVSSHALKQRRVDGVAFDGMIFTNLSPEHLDYHPDMEDYFQAKARLFRECALESIVAGKRPLSAINSRDHYGRKLLYLVRNMASRGLRNIGYSVKEGLRSGADGIQGRVDGVEIRSRLIGGFNIQNIVGAVTFAKGMGVGVSAIETGVERLVSVPGRLERIPAKGKTVFVDYAHKPDALEKVLIAIRELLTEDREGARLITVFGCGGDRDRSKRSAMGKIAVENSDLVYVTSDNPRTEDPDAIIREILAGTAGNENVKVEPDRKKAILMALEAANSEDIVLIAGKGHETRQILPDSRTPGGVRNILFDDRKIVAQAGGKIHKIQ